MKPAIIDIPGIGPVAEATLAEHGFRKLKKLARTSIERLATVPGFGEARAGKVIAAARELLPARKDKKRRKSSKSKDKQAKLRAGDKKGKRGGKDKKAGKGKKNRK
ncbi:MAG: helix-hairpin-helix domain-containing protein [Thiohalobacterales bacterium]|nr:helix-hairpin-helix domain-containing protein [Thiohalobacterales bacterium]